MKEQFSIYWTLFPYHFHHIKFVVVTIRSNSRLTCQWLKITLFISNGKQTGTWANSDSDVIKPEPRNGIQTDDIN